MLILRAEQYNYTISPILYGREKSSKVLVAKFICKHVIFMPKCTTEGCELPMKITYFKSSLSAQNGFMILAIATKKKCG